MSITGASEAPARRARWPYHQGPFGTTLLGEGEETALARAGAAAILLKGSGAAAVRAALARVVAGHARAPREQI